MRAPAIVVALAVVAGSAHADGGESRLAVGISLGAGTIGASRGEPSSRAFAMNFHGDVRVAHRLYVGFGVHGLMLARFAPDPTHAQDLATAYFGLRWRPFPGIPAAWGARRYGTDEKALYLSAGLGLAHITRPPYDSVWSSGDSGPWGFSVGGAVSYLPFRARDYALGFEASDFVSWLGKGARHAWAITIAIQLDMFD